MLVRAAPFCVSRLAVLLFFSHSLFYFHRGSCPFPHPFSVLLLVHFLMSSFPVSILPRRDVFDTFCFACSDRGGNQRLRHYRKWGWEKPRVFFAMSTKWHTHRERGNHVVQFAKRNNLRAANIFIQKSFQKIIRPWRSPDGEAPIENYRLHSGWKLEHSESWRAAQDRNWDLVKHVPLIKSLKEYNKRIRCEVRD